jgi:hypothetical protein
MSNMTEGTNRRGYLAAPLIPPPMRPPSRRTRAARWFQSLGPARWLLALCVIVGIAFAVLWIIGLWVYAGHDRLELIDDPQIASTAEDACAAMTLAVRQAVAPPNATNAAKVRAIQEQNAAVITMIHTIRSLGADRLTEDLPTADWLTDWQTLVDRRARHAQALATNRPTPFVVPSADGAPITERMNTVGFTCTVPAELTNLR